MMIINGTVERAHRADYLLSSLYQWPLYKFKRQYEKKPLSYGHLQLVDPRYMRPGVSFW